MAQTNSTRWSRRLLTAVVLLAMAGAGWQGWKWQADLRCRHITITGNRHAERAALLERARVDTTRLLYDIEPMLVADRLQRHPWVKSAQVTRRPTGTLAITVQERQPVALAVNEEGAPSFYLDRQGFAMPAGTEAPFDVPLLRAESLAYHPLQPVQDARVRAVLTALQEIPPTEEALISGLSVRPTGEVWLRTTPAEGRGSIQVRLGRRQLAQKVSRLQSFWRQAVLPRPDAQFTLIDLRFANQIVTREKAAVSQP